MAQITGELRYKAKRKPEDLPELETRTYKVQRILGKGSFGTVYQAKIEETGMLVAVKSISPMLIPDATGKLQASFTADGTDREVQVLKELGNHPNICPLLGAYYSDKEDNTKIKMNLVFEFISDTLHRIIKHYNQINKVGPRMDQYYIRMYGYGMLRGLAYMHGKGYAHCDIKPQNLLVQGKTHMLKICDFGTTKRLFFGQQRAAYVCSRYFRAPEIILGSTMYTTSVDLWSAGCVMAEMILGQCLFTGKDGADQLVEIFKVLGSPSIEQLQAMNPNYPQYQFQPRLAPHPWEEVLRGWASREANDLVSKLVCYDPTARLAPMPALRHRFFDGLRAHQSEDNRELFTFLEDELLWCTEKDVEKLIPAWVRNKS